MRFDPAGPYAVGHADVEYARRDSEPLLARVYRPEGVAGSWPILVDVHGGAWSAFDRRADANFDRALAACGMVVIALDFRQAPAHRWPTAAVDVAEGVRWAKRHAAEFDASPERLGIVGGSSGGHLAVAVALQARSREPAFAGDASPARVGSGTDAGPDASMAGADEGAEGIDASVDYAMPLWPILDPLARYRYLLERRARPEWVARDPFFQLERLIAAHDAFFGDEATMAGARVKGMMEEGDLGGWSGI